MKPILTAATITLVISLWPGIFRLPESRPRGPEGGRRPGAGGLQLPEGRRQTPEEAFQTAALVAQRGSPSTVAALPAILMTCPHHPDVLESKPGSCPYCKLPLVPVRLDSAWMCPVHTTVIGSSAGTCRMCGRRLVPVTVSLTWTCSAERTTEHLEPGTCADGSPRTRHETLRPHGNHNPQHGGQFFMAPDNWHHLEGIHPTAGVFRLYVYDDYGRPLPAATIKAMQARVVTKEAFDSATHSTKELTAFPLKPVAGQPYLEARIDPATLPAEISAKIRFVRDQPEYRFDFTFASLSKEPDAQTPGRAVTPVRSPSAAPSAPSAAETPPPALDPLTTVPIPATVREMLQQLDVRARQVGDLIVRGDFSSVWVPAFQAKDIAIALEPHVAHLSSGRRPAAEPALTRVVRTAWLLDAAGDVGNRAQIEAVHVAFKAAVADVLTTFNELR